MELIQNSVLNKEGKKWKQRWAVLKKVSRKQDSDEDSYYYLSLYKDASHAKLGKEKHVLPLIDFCGLNDCEHYERNSNVLIIITLTQTLLLTFEQESVKTKWANLILGRFGEAITYDISIQDKQRLKPRQATIRLYPTFVSIITNKHHHCLNRWFSNDILRYSAFDSSHFVFEVTTTYSKSKGQVFNLLVPNNAYEIAKAFDTHTCQQTADEEHDEVLVHADFHGSAILDELSQAKRNAGDQNFFQRVLLRASNRMKRNKKHRNRSTSEPTKSKRSKQFSPSVSDESKFCSLDRRKNPDFSLVLNEKSMMTAMQISAQVRSDANDAPPPLPTKHSHSFDDAVKQIKSNSVSHSVQLEEKPAFDSQSIPSSSTSLKDELDTTDTVPHVNGEKGEISSISSDTVAIAAENEQSESSIAIHPHSADAILTNKVSTKVAMGKCRKSSMRRNEKGGMPTPPPRSPISLGLEPTTVFEFPSTDNLNTIVNDTEMSDDAFSQNDEFSPHFTLDNPSPKEPLYSNIRRNNNNSLPADMNEALQKQAARQADPLSVEAWTKATGDGRMTDSSTDNKSKIDYVNIRGTKSLDDDFVKDLLRVDSQHRHHLSDDDADSYVNVRSDDAGGLVKRNKPHPLRLKSYKNDFEKYDDDDKRIYHAVGAMDDDRISHNSDGSYENKTRARLSTDYLNLMSPKSKKASGLNYIMVGGKEPQSRVGISSNSPVRQVPRSPNDASLDYTRIDENMTGALNKSMLEHRQHREKSRTASKMSK